MCLPLPPVPMSATVGPGFDVVRVGIDIGTVGFGLDAVRVGTDVGIGIGAVGIGDCVGVVNPLGAGVDFGVHIVPSVPTSASVSVPSAMVLLSVPMWVLMRCRRY